MCSVNLKDGGDKQQHYPFVVHIFYIGVVPRAHVAVEERHQNMIHGVYHEHARKNEEYVGNALYALEPLDGRVVALVGLHHLHDGKHARAEEEYPTHHLLPEQEAVTAGEQRLQQQLGRLQELLVPLLLLVAAIIIAGIVCIVIGPLFEMLSAMPE